MVFIKFLFCNVTPLFPILHYPLWQSPYEQLILVEQGILRMEYLQNYFEFLCIDLYICPPPAHVFVRLFIIPIWTGQGTNNGCYLWHIKRMDDSLDGWRLSFRVDNRSCNNKLCPDKNLYMNAQGSIFHNSQNVEIIQMVIEITQITHQGTSDCSKCDIAIKWNIICTEKVILSTVACY